MRKPIFESELQFRQFCSDCIPVNSDEPSFFTLRNSMEQSAKQYGWIKRSPAEEAEEAISEIYPILKKWAELNDDKQNFFIRNSSILQIIEGYNYLKKKFEDTEEK